MNHSAWFDDSGGLRKFHGPESRLAARAPAETLGLTEEHHDRRVSITSEFEEAGATPSSDGEPAPYTAAASSTHLRGGGGGALFSGELPSSSTLRASADSLLHSAAKGLFPSSTVPGKPMRTPPSSTTKFSGGQAAAASPANGHDDRVAYGHYLALLMASSGVFLSRPTTAAGGNARPSRPMSGGDSTFAKTASQHGVSSSVTAALRPTRPASAQPQRSPNAAAMGQPVGEASAKASAYVLRRPRPHSAAPRHDTKSGAGEAGDSNNSSSTTRQRSASTETLMPPSPLTDNSAAAPMVRVCVRRLVRPSSAVKGPQSGAAASSTEKCNASSIVSKGVHNRRPFVLAQPEVSTSSKKDGSGAATGSPAADISPSVGGQRSSARKHAPLPVEELGAVSPDGRHDTTTSASTEGNRMFLHPPLTKPVLFSRENSARNSARNRATPLQGRPRRSLSSSTSESRAPSVPPVDDEAVQTHYVDSLQGKPHRATAADAAPPKGASSAPPTPPLCTPSVSNESLRRTNSYKSFSSPSSRFAADSLREKGNEYFRKEDYENALRVYAEALRLDPQNTVIGCNRASAYLLTGQHVAALVECKYILLSDPSNMKAHWRAGKALLHMGRVAEARRHYRAARKASEAVQSQREVRMGSLSCSSLPTAAHGPGSSGHANHMKWLRECKALEVEESALDAYDKYVSCERQELYSDARQFLSVCLSAFCGGGDAAGPVVSATGLGSVPWRAKLLEMNAYSDPHRALDQVRELKRECNGGAATPSPSTTSGKMYLGWEPAYVHAMALFFCAHDTASTELCLRLLDDAARNLELQQATVERNIHAMAEWAAHATAAATRGTAPVSIPFDQDAWLRTYRVEADSRLVQLRSTIQQFVHYRDRGNAAYLDGQWSAAYDAYDSCLRLGGRNRSLLSTTYCNRSAVCMQSNRWTDALNDATEAVKCNGNNDKAYGRRARIHLRLFHQLQDEHRCEGGRESAAAARAALLRHLDGAIDDLRRCVELLAAAPEERQVAMDQLAKAQQLRQEFILASCGRSSTAPPTPPPRARPASGDAWRRAGGIPRGFFSSANFTRPASSPGGGGGGGGGAAAAAMTEHLTVLGLPTNTARVEAAVLARAYRQAALQWHPDKWVRGTEAEKQRAEKRFKEVNVAYQTLRDAALS